MASAGNQAARARELIVELPPYNSTHVTVPCDPAVVGSVSACYSDSVPAANNNDYPWGSPQTDYPKDGSPWGVHVTGPYPDGRTYLISWQSGSASVGPAASLPSAYCKTTPYVFAAPEAHVSTLAELGGSPAEMKGMGHLLHQGESISYVRPYTVPFGGQDLANYSYASPCVHHVVLNQLQPGTTYHYWVSVDGEEWTASPRTFTTLRMGQAAYPLRVALVGDLGQTDNSTQTRDHVLASKPDVIMFAGDHSYADDYGPQNNDDLWGQGTNQNRWDSYTHMMASLYERVPLVGCMGNHEIESVGIAATLNYTTTSFQYPDNFPFQSASARFPVPGSTGDWGNINDNLYYSTVLGGVAKLIVLNSYVPHYPGTPQYEWAVKEFDSVDRAVTPWLLVMYHGSAYHTYYQHYKELDAWLQVFEPLFYHAGVDVIVSGHVHAYERTHPVYQYQQDDCGPMYVTIGDGGNIEGPYRNFVDERDVQDGNVTYCDQLTGKSGLTPAQLAATDPGGWGASYQLQVQLPNATTMTWQQTYSVEGGPVLMPLTSGSSLGFCQSSQPTWSAHRDPSFGHGMLTLTSDTTATLTWYKNECGEAVEADRTELQRNTCTPAQRRRRLQQDVKGGRLGQARRRSHARRML